MGREERICEWTGRDQVCNVRTRISEWRDEWVNGFTVNPGIRCIMFVYTFREKDTQRDRYDVTGSVQ